MIFLFTAESKIAKRTDFNHIVDCSPYIDANDIDEVIKRYPYDSTDARCLRKARAAVIEEAQWVWKNAELFVYAENMKARFYSKDRTNVYVVNTDEYNHITGDWTKKGWKMKIRNGARAAWNYVRDTAVGAVRMLAVKFTGGAAAPLAIRAPSPPKTPPSPRYVLELVSTGIRAVARPNLAGERVLCDGSEIVFYYLEMVGDNCRNISRYRVSSTVSRERDTIEVFYPIEMSQEKFAKCLEMRQLLRHLEII